MHDALLDADCVSNARANEHRFGRLWIAAWATALANHPLTASPQSPLTRA